MSHKNLVVFVGCGGVFYHGLSRAKNWLSRREDVEILCIDPDQTEERNKLRQWPWLGLPRTKALIASYEFLNDSFATTSLVTRITTPQELQQATQEAVQSTTERIWVIHAPDNHSCRVVCHEGCGLLSSLPVYEITAGNSPNDGYAYGCIHQVNTTTRYVECLSNYMPRHKDILAEAQREAKQLAHPEPCGSQGEAPEQTCESNMLTACCLWNLADKMAEGTAGGEFVWVRNPDNRIVLRERIIQ